MRVEGTKLTLDLSWFSNNCDPKSGVAHATSLLLGPHAWADTESIYARLEDWLHWLFAKQQKAQTFLRVQCWALIGLSQQESWPSYHHQRLEHSHLMYGSSYHVDTNIETHSTWHAVQDWILIPDVSQHFSHIQAVQPDVACLECHYLEYHKL